MTRVQRTLLLAVLFLGLGGGAAAWVYHRDYKQQPARRKAELNEARPFTWGRFHIRDFTLANTRTTISASCTEKAGCRLTAPIQGPSDAQAMQALLDGIAGVQFGTVIASGDDARAKLADYGLDPAPITFTATTTDGRVHRLWVGEKNPTDGRRFLAGGEPLRLGLALDDFFWALDRDLFAFRSKQIFELDRDDIVKVTIDKVAVPPRQLVVSHGTPLWSVSTGDRTLPADPFVIDKFLLLLTRDLKADAFVTDAVTPELSARYGLDQPMFRVSIDTRSGHTERAIVGVAPRVPGTAPPDEDGQIAPYVRVEGSSSVSVAYPGLLTDLDKNVDGFRDRRVLDYDLAAPRKIEIMHAGKPPIVLEGERQTWRLVSPIQGETKTNKVSELVLRFSKLRGARVVEDGKPAARLKALELDPPQLRLVIRDGAGAVLADLRVGKPADAKSTHVTAEGVDRIDAVPDAELRLIPLSAEDLVAR